MSTTTVRSGSRPRRGAALRLRLDVAEWLVLRGALHEAVPSSPTPADFEPVAFGLETQAPLSAAERDRAWASLVARGLGSGCSQDLTGLVPGFTAGLLELLQPQLWVDVVGWSGDVALRQSIAWTGGRTVSLACRRRAACPRRTGDGPMVEQEPVVELAMADDGGLIDEVWRALPGRGTPDTTADTAPVRFGWCESAAVAHALRAGRDDVAAHLSGLPPEALALLGAVSTTLVGGTSISLRRDATPAVRGVWLWTDADVVELLDASQETVALRRTSVSRLRRDLLSSITGLLHTEEVL